MDTAREQRDREGRSHPPRSGRSSWIDALGEVPMVTGAVVGLFLLAAGLLGRRFSGNIRPLPPSGLWLISVALLAGGFLLGGFRFRREASAVPAVGRWVVYTALAAAGLLAAAFSVPGTPPLALGVLWLVFGVLLVALGNSAGEASPIDERPTIPAASTQEPVASRIEDEGDAALDVESLPDGVDQEIVRRRDTQAGVVIQGRLRVPFEAGQRNSSVHVAFCPPLPDVPAIAVDVVSGPPASARVGASLVQGARFDVRLADPCDEATAVIVAFFAQQSPSATTES
jgi:hypothetical protein